MSNDDSRLPGVLRLRARSAFSPLSPAFSSVAAAAAPTYFQPRTFPSSLPYQVEPIPEAQASSDGSVSGPRYVYDPTALESGGGTFKTWAEIELAVAAGQAAPEVLFVQPGAFVLPGSIDMRGGSFASVTQSVGVVELIAPDGVVIDNLLRLAGGLVLSASPSVDPALTFTDVPGYPVFQITGGAAFVNESTTRTAFSDVILGANITFDITGSSQNRAIISSSPWVEVLAGGLVQATPGGREGQFTDGWISGAGNLVYSVAMDFVRPAIAGFTGTELFAYTSDSRNFGPQSPGVVLGVSPTALSATKPTFQTLGSLANLYAAQVQTLSEPAINSASGWVELLSISVNFSSVSGFAFLVVNALINYLSSNDTGPNRTTFRLLLDGSPLFSVTQDTVPATLPSGPMYAEASLFHKIGPVTDGTRVISLEWMMTSAAPAFVQIDNGGAGLSSSATLLVEQSS